MVSVKYNDNKRKQWNKRIPKMKSLLTRHGPEKPATLAIQGSLPTEPWPVCSAPHRCWCWCRNCRGQDLRCSSREQPSFPWVGEGPWSLSFTLYSWDIWNGNEGPQTTLVFHFMSYPVIPRLSNKGSYRHSHFAACQTHGPGYDPHGAAASGHWRLLKARDSGSGFS